MFVELLLLLGAAVLALTFLFQRDIVEFIELVKFKRTLKGPPLSEVIENSTKERKW